MKLNDVLKQQIRFARDSGVEVRTNRAYSVATITAEDVDIVFQGDEYYHFIDEVVRLYNEIGTISIEDAELLAAYPYL